MNRSCAYSILGEWLCYTVLLILHSFVIHSKDNLRLFNSFCCAHLMLPCRRTCCESICIWYLNNGLFRLTCIFCSLSLFRQLGLHYLRFCCSFFLFVAKLILIVCSISIWCEFSNIHISTVPIAVYTGFVSCTSCYMPSLHWFISAHAQKHTYNKRC